MQTYLLQALTTLLGHANLLTMTWRWGWAPSTGSKTFYFSRSKYLISVLTGESEPTNMFSIFQKTTFWDFLIKCAVMDPIFLKKRQPPLRLFFLTWGRGRGGQKTRGGGLHFMAFSFLTRISGKGLNFKDH